MQTMLQCVKAVRSQLTALNIQKNAVPHIILRGKTPDFKALIETEVPTMQSLLKSLVSNCQITSVDQSDQEPKGALKNHVNDDIQVFLQVQGLIDVKLEVGRLKKRNGELQKLVDNTKAKMNKYSDKVPQEVRNTDAEKLQTYIAEKDSNEQSIKELEELL